MGRVVPTGLLSTLVVSINEQPLVTGRPLLIRRMMMIAFATKGLGRDKFGFVEAEQSGNATWESISTTIKRE